MSFRFNGDSQIGVVCVCICGWGTGSCLSDLADEEGHVFLGKAWNF